MITNKRVEESFKKVLETKEVPAENPDNYYYGKAEKNIEYSQVNPDNMKVNKKLPESKMQEAFDFEDDDDLGYDDFDYEGEITDDYYDYDRYYDDENALADTFPTRELEYTDDEDNGVLPFGDESQLGDGTGDIGQRSYQSAISHNIYSGNNAIEIDGKVLGADDKNGWGRNVSDLDFAINDENPDLNFEESESFAIPRNMRESRALPGGMLNSEEKTAYEDFLRERHLKQDKVKNKEYGKNKLGLYDDECGENGWHNWDGTKIERKIKNK